MPAVAPGAEALTTAVFGPEMDLSGLFAVALAWARAAPTVAIVPAFGLQALPAPARMGIALVLAGCIFPSVAPSTAFAGPGAGAASWAALALIEVARGLPVAVAAAVPLWAATMAGGVADALRGSNETPNAAVVEGRPTPLGVPLSILASAIFLAMGGPARVAAVLASRPVPDHALLAAAADLTGGISLAVALGAPLLAASVVVEVAAALVARAAAPAQVHALLAPLRATATLAVLGIVLDGIARVLAIAVRAVP
ncbi:MAG TPA: flagellar biosynthetic protein FliR [Polyangiaceae bacterium]|nr:flagellar biosynthetic protein FliR [Polyangiaceae bacterium]